MIKDISESFAKAGEFVAVCGNTVRGFARNNRGTVTAGLLMGSAGLALADDPAYVTTVNGIITALTTFFGTVIIIGGTIRGWNALKRVISKW